MSNIVIGGYGAGGIAQNSSYADIDWSKDQFDLVFKVDDSFNINFLINTHDINFGFDIRNINFGFETYEENFIIETYNINFSIHVC